MSQRNLKKFFWRLWLVLSLFWIAAYGLLGSWIVGFERLSRETEFWGVLLIPPFVLLLVGAAASWVIAGLRNDMKSGFPSGEPSDAEIAKKRRELGYDE